VRHFNKPFPSNA